MLNADGPPHLAAPADVAEAALEIAEEAAAG